MFVLFILFFGNICEFNGEVLSLL